MDLFRKASRPPLEGHDHWFTGQIKMDPIVSAEPPGRPGMVDLYFTPGARTHWHTHPAGQTLIITEGEGRVQTEGQPVRRVFAGDVVWFPAGERHWHGAAPDQPMRHIAIQSAEGGRTVDWETPVSDKDYLADPQD